MPPKKRPYVPKTKGCYECSQRRIHCDRGKPQCQKCISKGLKCSGLGIRHRFNKGVASRGKWAGRAMDAIYQDEGRVCIPKDLDSKDQTDGSEELHTSPEESPTITQAGSEKSSAGSPESSPELIFLEEVPALAAVDEISCLTDDLLLDPVADSPHPDTAGVDFPWNACTLFRPLPDHVPRWKRNLLLHFSRNIAKEMVAIDGHLNGWRNLLLPFCEMDELVLNACVTVAAFHLCLNGPSGDGQLQSLLKQTQKQTLKHKISLYGDDSQMPDPNQLYATVILGLQQRKLTDCDQLTKYSIFLTILVLLTGVMVTGCSDFPTLFRMMESALHAVGGEAELGAGEVADFLVPQIQKMRVYAAPLLSEESGLEILSSQTHAMQLFSCLKHWSQQYPEHSVAVSFIMDLVKQALDIYLRQVRFRSVTSPSYASEMEESIRRVQRFKETWEAFPHNSQGEQVLVWASFMAASGCMLDEHKAFFEGVFIRHYERSGFGNTLIGLDYLHKIWARDPGERWTSLLPRLKILMM